MKKSEEENKTRVEAVAQIFRNFAELECKGRSDLYFRLSSEIAQDTDLLVLANQARARQPIPNLFLAAVHYLLLRNDGEELANYYPSITPQAEANIPFGLFKDFCFRKKEEMLVLIQDRIVQTNAINRTAYLMPIFSSLLDGKKDVNLIDIGTSSGLSLNFDLYEYDYGAKGHFGESQVKIKSEIKEGQLPSFTQLPHIKRKIGIDQNPLDLREETNATWLKALIWPDLTARFKRLEAAIELNKQASTELIKASWVEDFAKVINIIPAHEPLLVYHTHVLYQFTLAERKAFRAMLGRIGAERDLHYLAVEGNTIFARGDKHSAVQIELTTYDRQGKTSRLLAETDGHANWIKWL